MPTLGFPVGDILKMMTFFHIGSYNKNVNLYPTRTQFHGMAWKNFHCAAEQYTLPTCKTPVAGPTNGDMSTEPW